MRGFGRYVASFALVCAGLATPTPSRALDYPNILGNWCSETSKYTFTREMFSIYVFATRGEGSFKIIDYSFDSEEVDVGWFNPEAGERHAVFGEFSQDGAMMFQLARGSAPHKRYQRC
jgi:hypothetical protein